MSGKRWIESKYGLFPIDDDPSIPEGAIVMLRQSYEQAYEAAQRDPLALEHIEKFLKSSLDVLAIIATGVQTMTILAREFNSGDVEKTIRAIELRIEEIVREANEPASKNGPESRAGVSDQP